MVRIIHLVHQCIPNSWDTFFIFSRPRDERVAKQQTSQPLPKPFLLFSNGWSFWHPSIIILSTLLSCGIIIITPPQLFLCQMFHLRRLSLWIKLTAFEFSVAYVFILTIFSAILLAIAQNKHSKPSTVYLFFIFNNPIE